MSVADIPREPERVRLIKPSPSITVSTAAKAMKAAGKPVIFYCASGARTRMNASALDAIGGAEPKILAGGIMGWAQAGYPIARG